MRSFRFGVYFIKKRYQYTQFCHYFNRYVVILHMCTGQSKLLDEEAARLCVEGNACRYSYFMRCLKQMTERTQQEQQKLPSHKNLRGKEFYK